MRINTNQDAARAIERLRTRDPKSLAALIVSLAQDAGPVGEQVRTFIVGDDVKEASMSLKERIESLGGCSEREHRSRRGQEVVQRPEFILDAVEILVVPVDPKGAFELLMLVMESDEVAMENSGDHDHAVSCAFKRAAGLMAQAAAALPSEEVEATLKRLIAEDAYGVRGSLAEAMGEFRRAD